MRRSPATMKAHGEAQAPLRRVRKQPAAESTGEPPAPYHPTANSWEFRQVRVAKGERTCLGCGEVFARGICPRCGLPEPGEHGGRRRAERLPATVPTESYLLPEEYRQV